MIDVLFVRELARAGRGRLIHYARWAYAGWLILVLYFSHAVYYSEYLLQSPAGRWPAGATTDFAHRLVDLLVFQQTMVVLLIGPSFAAGAVTDEKVRGTLEPLFLAHLTPAGIILGKLLARVAQGFLWSLAAWPVIAFLGFPGGVTPVFFVALAAVTILMLLGSCAISLLVSVWCRTTRDAVVVLYILMAVMMLSVQSAHRAGPSWEFLEALDPNYVLDTARDAPDYGVLGSRLRLTFLTWSLVAVICTSIAAWRLRPAFIKQQTRRRSKVLAAISFRPPMSERPIQWKEQYSTRIPRWFGIVVVGAIATIATAWLMIRLPTPSMSLEAIMDAHWVLVFLSSLAVGVRASGAVVTERDRRTWDCLACTPYDFRRIVNDKISGICMSVWPYYFAALIPSLAVCSLANIDQVIAAMPATAQVQTKGVASIIIAYAPKITFLLLGPGLTLGGLVGLVLLAHRGLKLPWYPYCAGLVAMTAGANTGPLLIFVPVGIANVGISMFFMACVGLWISARASSAWLSLLGTVLVGYMAATVVLAASCPIGCLVGCVGATLTAGMSGGGGPADFARNYLAVLLFGGGLLGLWWAGQLFAQWAVQYLEKTDRVPGNYIREIELDGPYAPKD